MAERSHRGAAWIGAVAGAAAGGVAMAFGELVNGFNPNVPSLVTAIGELVVEFTPGDLVAFSISNVGDSQKPLLIVGIVIGTFLLGALAGFFAVKRWHRAVVGMFAVAGVLAGWAAARNPMSPAVGSWIVGLLAAAAGYITLYVVLGYLGYDWPWLRSLRRNRSDQDATDLVLSGSAPDRPDALTSRRGFLAYAGAGITAAVLFGLGRQQRASNITSAAREARSLPPAPASGSLIEQVRSLDTLDSVDRITSYITPNDRFYRIDTAIVLPNVDPANWSLEIEGMVDNPYTLTLDDLEAMDLREYAITLSCVSNQVGGDLVGNAIWTGVPLAEVLEKAGVHSGADQIVGRSVDRWTAGFPTDIVNDGRNAILAIGMNGEPLPVRHGFPARLVVAGLYGYVSAVKWISNITLTTWDGFDGYWVPRGWSKEGPMKTQSRIDVPKRRDPLVAGTSIPVAGIAWAPTRGIERVEVRISDADSGIASGTGGDWSECRLAESLNNETWVQWVYDWTPTAGEYDITVRATDSTGETQGFTPVPPRPNGSEGWHQMRVKVEDA